MNTLTRGVASTASAAFTAHTALPSRHQSTLRPSSFTCNTLKRQRSQPTSITRAALSTGFFRAAAAAATISFTSLIYPAQSYATVASPNLNSPSTAFSSDPNHHYVVSGSPSTSNEAPLRVNASPSSVVGVSKSSIHDYRSASLDPISIGAAVTSTNLPQTDESAKGEMMLAARLITAVMMGVMLGVERSATALNLGIRSITVISLSSAIFSLFLTYSDHLFPTSVSTVGYSTLAFGIASQMTPVATALLLACVTSIAVYVVMRVKYFYYNQKHFGANQKISSNLSLFKSMSAVVGLSVGMGVACGAGLGLMTAGFYLGGVAVMRSDTAVQQHHAKSMSTSPAGRRAQQLDDMRTEASFNSPNRVYDQKTGNHDDHDQMRGDLPNSRRPPVDSVL